MTGVSTLWTVLRGGYNFVNIVSLSVILTTGENLVGANLILLMESDAVVEGICEILEHRIQAKARRSVAMLSVTGCAISIGMRIVITWVMFISFASVYNPISMQVLSLGFASFGFIFYQAYALVVVKQYVDRIGRLVRGNNTPANGSSAVELYGRKAGRIRWIRKDMAFHLLNEGMDEMSSYAKTIAGMIAGKKLFPMRSLSQNSKEPLDSSV